MMRRASLAAVLAPVIALVACAPPPPGQRSTPAASGAELGYAPPPAATGAARLTGGRVMLSGTTAPGNRVRLATPTGAAYFAPADPQGAWRVILPPADGVRLFGLSAPMSGRVVQAEGYLAVTPRGEAVQFRAGSGALVLGPPGRGVALLAVDFDGKGGTVLSGSAPAGGPVKIEVDGQARGPATADATGRFMLALNEPLSAGDHLVAVSAAAAGQQATLTISKAPPLNSGPFRATGVVDGWRVDWLTPGGGVQSTVLLETSRG